MGMKLGVVGANFGHCFIPLFQAHPLVDEVVLADLNTKLLQETAKTFKVKTTYSSLEELLKSDVDAIALYTPRHLHGTHTLQALRAGKHVYAAVPIASELEEIEQIIDEVKQSRLIYMSGETSYYYGSAIYCRQRYKQGDFGDFVYGEGAYYHDMSHGFYEVFKRLGEGWQQKAGFPPMYYPTHSTSIVLSAIDEHMTEVSCMGYKDQVNDGVFKGANNLWNNPFSNETAIMRTSGGGVCRINEFRRVGFYGNKIKSVRVSLYGTQGSYEEHAGGQVWAPMDPEAFQDVTDLLEIKKLDQDLAPMDPNYFKKNVYPEFQDEPHNGYSSVHPIDRLPVELLGLPNGHQGSHQFLVDDFVKSVDSGKLPPNHAWAAARYCIPGLIAHDSAMREGELHKIPDLGEPPEDWELLNPDE